MSETKLEPCPFCGQKPQFTLDRSHLDLRDGWFARVSCHGSDHISSSSAKEATQDEAERNVVERWNVWAVRAKQRFGNPRVPRLENILRRHGIQVPE